MISIAGRAATPVLLPLKKQDIMTKRYKSSAHLAINIVMESGVNVHLSFKPLTGGGSYYITDDEKMQEAIERHRSYNVLFVGQEVVELPKAAPVAKEEPKGPKQITVSSLDDAKDYMAERFGYSRTKLRSKAAILAAGEEHGIEFIGI